MVSIIKSAVINGMDVIFTEVETGFIRGIPGITIVGLPDNAVRESRERIRFAIKNSGFGFPGSKKILINLSPADIKKEGSVLDLSIAVSIIMNHYQLSSTVLEDYLFCGELNLEGRINPVKGILNIAVFARKEGYKGIIIPEGNRAEGTSINGIDVFCFNELRDVVQFIKEPGSCSPEIYVKAQSDSSADTDFSEIRGQYLVKRAMEIAAAGSHNLLMVGPPGSGKSMISKALPSILPEMTEEEILETSMIYSSAGLLNQKNRLINYRPFRSPHHTISSIGISGGGKFPVPGEISLAHNGVLFLDELPYFSRSALEVLRQPMEDGTITISRSLTSATYPARFMFIAAMNSFEDTGGVNPVYSSYSRSRYYNKISKPLLDRIDLKIAVQPVEIADITSEVREESSESIRARVTEARDIQKRRFMQSGRKTRANGHMSNREVNQCCKLQKEQEQLLKSASEKIKLSARSYFRTLKLSRTIADLAQSEYISTLHIQEALQYRLPELFSDEPL